MIVQRIHVFRTQCCFPATATSGTAWKIIKWKRDNSASERRPDGCKQTTHQRRRRARQPKNNHARSGQRTAGQDNVSWSSHEGLYCDFSLNTCIFCEIEFTRIGPMLRLAVRDNITQFCSLNYVLFIFPLIFVAVFRPTDSTGNYILARLLLGLSDSQ